MYPVNICSTTNRWIYPLSPAKIQILFRRYRKHPALSVTSSSFLFFTLCSSSVWPFTHLQWARCTNTYEQLDTDVYQGVICICMDSTICPLLCTLLSCMCVCVVASYWKALSDFTSQFQINFCEFSHRKMEKNDKFNSERSAAGYVTPKASKLRCCEWSTDSRNI